jgi:hypothetical protein
MQIANVARRLECTQYCALGFRCSAAEQGESLVCMNSKDHVVVAATLAIGEFNRGSVVELDYTFDSCAQMQSVTDRYCFLKRIYISLGAITKGPPPQLG